MACTGRCGTTTKACQRIRVSSTMRTSSSECHDSGRSKCATSPAPSMKIWEMRFRTATTCTPQQMRTQPPSALRMEQRKFKRRKTDSSNKYIWPTNAYIFSFWCFQVGCTRQKVRQMEAVIGARSLNMEVEDTTKTCVVRKRTQWSNCSSSKTTCGWTEEPELCFWISLSTMRISTCFASPGRNHQSQQYPSHISPQILMFGS